MNLFVRIISSKYTKLIYLTTSLFGFLLLIPLYLSYQPFLKSFGLALFIPFVVLAAIYFLLSLIFIIFSHKLSLKWSYGIAGLAAGFGLTYLALAPLQALFYLMAANLKEDPGLAGLIFFAPTMAIFYAPFQALVLGFIGHRLGRREELTKQVEAGQIEAAALAKEGIGLILLDVFGIFILGGSAIVGYQQIAYEIEKLGLKFDGNLYFPLLANILKYFSVPGFLYLGFYLPRLIAKKIWHEKIPSHTLFRHILAIIAIFILILVPLGSRIFANFVYKSNIRQLSSETKTVYLNEKIVIDPTVVALPYNKAPKQLVVNFNISIPKTGTYFFDFQSTNLSYFEPEITYANKRQVVGRLAIVKIKEKTFEFTEKGSLKVELENGDQELTLIFSINLAYKPENTYSFYQNQQEQLEVHVLAYPSMQQCTTCAVEPDTSTVFVTEKFATLIKYNYKDFE